MEHAVLLGIGCVNRGMVSKFGGGGGGGEKRGGGGGLGGGGGGCWREVIWEAGGKYCCRRACLSLSIVAGFSEGQGLNRNGQGDAVRCTSFGLRMILFNSSNSINMRWDRISNYMLKKREIREHTA